LDLRLKDCKFDSRSSRYQVATTTTTTTCRLLTYLLTYMYYQNGWLSVDRQTILVQFISVSNTMSTQPFILPR